MLLKTQFFRTLQSLPRFPFRFSTTEINFPLKKKGE